MMISPMVGELTAQLITGQATSVPLRSFALERFERGESKPEAMVIG